MAESREENGEQPFEAKAQGSIVVPVHPWSIVLVWGAGWQPSATGFAAQSKKAALEGSKTCAEQVKPVASDKCLKPL